MDKDLQKIYRRTGLFVFSAAIILVFFLVFIAQQQRTFSRKYSFFTVLYDSVGLEKNSPVVFKGTEIGRISYFSFNEQRNVEVHFHIYNEYRDLLVEYSAVNKNVNPLSGRASLDFLMGPLDGHLIEEDELIPSLDTDEGKRLLAEQKIHIRPDQISAIIANIGEFAANLNRDDNFDQGSFFRMIYNLADASENLNHSLVNFNNIMTSLQHDTHPGEGTLARLAVNLADLTEDLRVTNSLMAKNLMNLDIMIQNYTSPDDLMVRMFDPSQENIVKPLSNSLNSLAENLDNINEMTEFLSSHTPEMAILMSETKKTLSEMQKTLQGLNNNPLLRRGIKREELPSSGERIRLIDID